MKVLDLPDNQDNSIRKMLLQLDDSILEELTKKSKAEIQKFLLSERKNEVVVEVSNNKDKLFKLQSAFPKSVLDKNPNIAKMLEDRNFDGLLSFLKS